MWVLALAAAFELSVNATSVANGDWVRAELAGVPAAARGGCWLGVFFATADLSRIPPQGFPATEPWVASAPVQYMACSKDAAFAATGRGSYELALLSYREPLMVAVFSNGTAWPHAENRTAAIVAKDAAEPRYPRLAWAAPDAMRLTWSSAGQDQSEVKLDGGNESRTFPAYSSTYSASDLCGEPASTHGFALPGWQHTAVLTGLSPGTEYTYAVGSMVGRFVMPDVDADSVKVGVIADVGASPLDGSTVHWTEPAAISTYLGIGKYSPDVWLHIGDLSYATGYGAKWDLYLSQVSPLAGRVPYMTGLGNHEQDWPTGAGIPTESRHDSGGECGVPTTQRFPMPAEDQLAGYYSFRQGPMTYVMLNTEWPAGKGSAQYDFLAKTLAAVDRSKTPWLLVGGHRPMYSGNSAYRSDGIVGMDDVEDLFLAHSVDFYLAGHVHNVQLSCPIYRGKCGRGPVHAVIGNGGQSLSHFPEPRAAWSVFQAKTWGYNELELSRASAQLRFYDEAGTLLHSANFSKPGAGPEPSRVLV